MYNFHVVTTKVKIKNPYKNTHNFGVFQNEAALNVNLLVISLLNFEL
jgi:hypothetical protein